MHVVGMDCEQYAWDINSSCVTANEDPEAMAAHSALLRRTCERAACGLALGLALAGPATAAGHKLLEKLLELFQEQGLENVEALTLQVGCPCCCKIVSLTV
jgi:hypothetical protein